VAEGVSKVLGVKGRAVELRMKNLPRNVYALHLLGTNTIVLNEEALHRLSEELSGDRAPDKFLNILHTAPRVPAPAGDSR